MAQCQNCGFDSDGFCEKCFEEKEKLQDSIESSELEFVDSSLTSHYESYWEGSEPVFHEGAD